MLETSPVTGEPFVEGNKYVLYGRELLILGIRPSCHAFGPRESGYLIAQLKGFPSKARIPTVRCNPPPRSAVAT